MAVQRRAAREAWAVSKGGVSTWLLGATLGEELVFFPPSYWRIESQVAL